MGVAVVFFQSQTQLDPAWRLALVTGFLGALTTFSTFSAEVVAMLQHGRYLLAFGTAGLHLLGSLAPHAAGHEDGGRLVRHRGLRPNRPRFIT